VGDVGELTVPDSLHALLAARLDALDPGVRRLVADAAVLGTSFPAEALIAVSGLGEPAVRAGLAELLRREVLSVSADPLSPERGSYQFAQEMLRQVAYDTLSRRDRKTRHLKVAAHLRNAFPGDGEEVTDVLARHYLDALHAIPGDPDTARIREQAIAALTRAGERAERTGAPARAATAYATAAQLTLTDTPPGRQAAATLWERAADAGVLWERAADAAITSADWAAAIEHAGRAREYYLQAGQARAAARAQATAGRALRLRGGLAEARDQLTSALDVLRADPDADTVRALDQLALVEVFAGTPDADRLTAEALTLGQALDAGTGQLVDLFITRGICLGLGGRRPEAVAYYREAVRLATQAGDNARLGRALMSMSHVLAVDDPAAAAETARTAAGHLRRTGEHDLLAWTITHLAEVLILLGDWDTAQEELTQAADSDGLAGVEYLTCLRAWLSALRGDADGAGAVLAALGDLLASERPQDKALILIVEAFAAAARRQPENALRHARGTLAHAGALDMSHESMRWAWPLAARSAHELGDTAATGELLALLDSCQPGHLAPMLRAERDLVRARLVADEDGRAAAASFASAITSLREQSTPYHLAHGLLDHARHLLDQPDAAAAAAAIGEVGDIARRLRCQPLLDRAAAMTSAQPQMRA
jgi:tetratricopeptide (TPR) repeat protein